MTGTEREAECPKDAGDAVANRSSPFLDLSDGKGAARTSSVMDRLVRATGLAGWLVGGPPFETKPDAKEARSPADWRVDLTGEIVTPSSTNLSQDSLCVIALLLEP